jgi:hypothetical protein
MTSRGKVGILLVSSAEDANREKGENQCEGM